MVMSCAGVEKVRSVDSSTFTVTAGASSEASERLKVTTRLVPEVLTLGRCRAG